MSNSVDSDETANNEPFYLDLRCLQKPILPPVACDVIYKSLIRCPKGKFANRVYAKSGDLNQLAKQFSAKRLFLYSIEANDSASGPLRKLAY